MSNLPNPEDIIFEEYKKQYENTLPEETYPIPFPSYVIKAMKEYGKQVRDKTIERIAEEIDHKWLNEHVLNFKNHKDLEI